MIPEPFDVVDYLGRSGNAPPYEQLATHLRAVTAMVKAYTRGRGFTESGEPADDLALVIITSVARLATNPDLTVTSQIDDFAVRHTVFDGWTLPELAVLHRYRRRTA